MLELVATDVVAEQQRRAAAGTSAPAISERPDWWNRRCRRMLKAAAIMKQELDNVMLKWSGPAWLDSDCGKLILEETKAVHAAVKDLIRSGCLTGALSHSVYFECSTVQCSAVQCIEVQRNASNATQRSASHRSATQRSAT